MAELLHIGEVFGRDIATREAAAECGKKWCPFTNVPCTKSSKETPLGICSLTDGKRAITICPTRFREENVVFKDAARLAFGEGSTVNIVSELRILRKSEESTRKLGKVDYMLVKMEDNEPVDFAALEVQAVYFCGGELPTTLAKFMAGQSIDDVARRPDWLSSQKRLMPQLNLKVPVFRRWGKKFFVATDMNFFNALPGFPCRSTSVANSELTWLVYPFDRGPNGFTIGTPEVRLTVWDDVKEALREGIAPEPGELLAELAVKIKSKKSKATITV